MKQAFRTQTTKRRTQTKIKNNNDATTEEARRKKKMIHTACEKHYPILIEIFFKHITHFANICADRSVAFLSIIFRSIFAANILR